MLLKADKQTDNILAKKKQRNEQCWKHNISHLVEVMITTIILSDLSLPTVISFVKLRKYQFMLVHAELCHIYTLILGSIILYEFE